MKLVPYEKIKEKREYLMVLTVFDLEKETLSVNAAGTIRVDEYKDTEIYITYVDEGYELIKFSCDYKTLWGLRHVV